MNKKSNSNTSDEKSFKCPKSDNHSNSGTYPNSDTNPNSDTLQKCHYYALAQFLYIVVDILEKLYNLNFKTFL